eukprot:m.163047 g.163047  ORF g.163047 m.163047 type:complete len:1162 (-) comp17105_c0_seq3:2223-5708(-)
MAEQTAPAAARVGGFSFVPRNIAAQQVASASAVQFPPKAVDGTGSHAPPPQNQSDSERRRSEAAVTHSDDDSGSGSGSEDEGSEAYEFDDSMEVVAAPAPSFQASGHTGSSRQSELEGLRKDDFVIDHKGDKHNREYQSLYKGDVAQYRRPWHGQVVADGATVWMEFVDGRDGKRFTSRSKAKRREASRYFEAVEVPDKDLIRIVPTKPSKRNRWDSLERKPEPPLMFIPLESQQPTASATQPGPQPDKGAEQVSQPHSQLQERTRKFNEKLRQHPEDAALWRQYVDFQDEVFAAESLHPQRNANILVEKKISIYEQALKHHPRNEEFIAEYLELCHRTLDVDVLAEKWKKVIFVNVSSIRLWRLYLQYMASELLRFRLSGMVAEHQRCIERFAAIKNGTFSSHKLPLIEAESGLLAVSLLAAATMQAAGYSERAIALLQALVDFAVVSPPELQAKRVSAADHRDFFAIYWSQQLPHFGEKGFVGFPAWLAQHMKGRAMAPTEFVYPPLDPDLPSGLLEWDAWWRAETWREQTHWLPWRADATKGITEEDQEDPDRIVLFEDDVVPFLFTLDLLDAKEELLFRVFAQCGASLPARRPSCHAVTLDEALFVASPGLLLDPLVHLLLDLARADSQGETVPNPASLVRLRHGVVGCSTEVWGPVVSAASSHASSLPCLPVSDAPLWIRLHKDDVVFLGGARGWWPVSHRQLPADRQQFLSNMMEQACTLLPQANSLKLASIYFAATLDVKSAKKKAKALLKDAANRNNLSLYDIYARLELATNDAADALKVLHTALKMASSALDKADWRSTAPLFFTLMEAELSASHKDLALAAVAGYALGSLAEESTGAGGGLAPTRLAKARAAYASMRAAWMPPPAATAAAPSAAATTPTLAEACCMIWFEYLSSGWPAAAAVVDGLLVLSHHKHTVPGSLFLEQLTCASLRLLHYHDSQSAVAPATLRTAILRALDAHPSNPELHAALILSQARCRVAGRLRTFYDKLLATNPASPVPWLFAIHAEAVQLHTVAVHRIRSLFERFAQSKARKCPLLWRMYMEFCYAQAVATGGDPDLATKGVFYQAMQCRPGVKDLYLDAVRLMPGRLQEVVDLLQEKELHLRVPLEELEINQEVEAEAARAARLKMSAPAPAPAAEDTAVVDLPAYEDVE